MVSKGAETGARADLMEAVVSARGHSAGRMTLERFLKSVERKKILDREDRLRIVDQALLLLEMNYVHLPLKRAMHAIDPIQRLKLLRFRLGEMKEADLPTEMHFHQRILEIFASTRDLHTLYLLPAPYKDKVAYLPFLIEQCFEKHHTVEKFIVSQIVDEVFRAIPDPGPGVVNFQRGVEVLYWNGLPIRRAIELNGETQAGSNPEARFARGLDNLTIRPLDTSLPPDESWVSITYRSRKGETQTLEKQKWLVYAEGAPPLATITARNKREAIDLKKTKINQVKGKLYKRGTKLFAPRDVPVRKNFQDLFYAEIRTVGRREVGYIRLFSFEADHPDSFVAEFKRVITSAGFPQEGLIIDVRGNPGGQIRAGERLLQLFTPRRIVPELFEFINTPLNLEICRHAPKNWELSRWAKSIADAVQTGAIYSNGFPYSSEEDCNDIGQVYHGPVVLITDALSYSTTDMFAAGFQDNEVGEILGTSDNTGAGGANFWRHRDLMVANRKAPNSPFKPLPKGAQLVVAVRRSIRVGKYAGRPLEELGITPDHRHYVTKRDLLRGNVDLISTAARILAKKPVYSLSVKPFGSKAGARGVIVTAGSKIPRGKKVKNISHVDIYKDGRAYRTISAKNGLVKATRVSLGSAPGRSELLVSAFDGANNLVAAYRYKS